MKIKSFLQKFVRHFEFSKFETKFLITDPENRSQKIIIKIKQFLQKFSHHFLSAILIFQNLKSNS